MYEKSTIWKYDKSEESDDDRECDILAEEQ